MPVPGPMPMHGPLPVPVVKKKQNIQNRESEILNCVFSKMNNIVLVTKYKTNFNFTTQFQNIKFNIKLKKRWYNIKG